MQSGKLDRRITIQAPINGPEDDAGHSAIVWEDVAIVWCEVIELRATERQSVGQVAGFNSKKFRIRYSSQVSQVGTKNRILYNDAIYDIEGVQEVGRREGLVLFGTCKAD